MLVQNVKLTLLKVVHKEGNAKSTGKPYAFDTLSTVDGDSNVFAFNLGDAVDVSRIRDAKNVPISVDIEFYPKGFDISGRVVALSILDEDTE